MIEPEHSSGRKGMFRASGAARPKIHVAPVGHAACGVLTLMLVSLAPAVLACRRHSPCLLAAR